MGIPDFRKMTRQERFEWERDIYAKRTREDREDAVRHCAARGIPPEECAAIFDEQDLALHQRHKREVE